MKEIINKLNSPEYSVGRRTLSELLTKGKLPFKDFREILLLKEKLIVANFLEEYQYFDKENLEYMQTYILEHLNNNDRLFVSDLIEFASYWDLIIPFEKCLELVKVYKGDNHFVQLAIINYIFENMKYNYIEETVRALSSILDNPHLYQNVQVKAAFTLFRITMNPTYLNDLIDLIVNGDVDNNKEQLNNILKWNYNQREFFSYHDLLQIICKKKEV